MSERYNCTRDEMIEKSWCEMAEIICAMCGKLCRHPVYYQADFKLVAPFRDGKWEAIYEPVCRDCRHAEEADADYRRGE